ncbi:MAG: ferritin [Candidatus Electryoneaceae bacterium]|nr:ferritin [Candidatus Electryoneaceae bacterium]
MLPKKMEEALNAQLNAEIYSAYLYMSMAAYFESFNLSGFANWMKIQAQEELSHAQKFFDYINERGGRVIMQMIDKPETDWESTLAAFEFTYLHEQKVTALINDLVDLARVEKDNATYNFLQWFVSEQVEEESSVDAVVQKLHLIGDYGPGVFMIDQELATRVFTPPATGA